MIFGMQIKHNAIIFSDAKGLWLKEKTFFLFKIIIFNVFGKSCQAGSRKRTETVQKNGSLNFALWP